jgi:hypothetical protein
VSRSNILIDEKRRKMLFPTRQDYIDLLVREGLINNEKEFIDRPEFIEAVYLDWLRRGQVGCIFAQLLSRRNNRKHIRTCVLNGPIDRDNVEKLAKDIDRAVEEAVADSDAEALTVLLPSLLDIVDLVSLVLTLSKFPQWVVEREQSWRGTTTLIGLRRQIAEGVWAEILVLAGC